MKIRLVFLLLFILALFSSPSFSDDQSSNISIINTIIIKNEISNTEIVQPLQVSVLFSQMGINTSTYNTLELMPEFDFMKLSVGLDLNFYYNTNGDFTLTEWNSWQALVMKVNYLKFGAENDPFYLDVGYIDDFTLGDGFIVKDYSGTLNYPEVKKLGIICNLNFHYIGLDAMADNILLWDFMAMRVYTRPFIDIASPLISGLEIGVTAADDLYPQNVIPDPSTPYNFINNTSSSQTVLSYGIDISMPILNLSALSLKGFADYSLMQNEGSGEMVGLSGSFFQTIPYNFQLRILQPEFLPSYFDVFYDNSRSYKYQTLDMLTGNNIGWFASTGVSLLNNLFVFNVQYDGFFSDVINPDLEISCELLSKLLKFIGFKVTYLRQNFTDINDLFLVNDGSTLIIVTLKLYIQDNLIVTIDYERNFQYLNNVIQPYVYSTVSTLIRF